MSYNCVRDYIEDNYYCCNLQSIPALIISLLNHESDRQFIYIKCLHNFTLHK